MTQGKIERLPGRLLDYPNDALKAAAVGGTPKRVGVIGAGIAGLVAAYELEHAGHDVTVYEATSRAGGRIHTYHFGEGLYGELGAMRIPSNHRCTLHYVDSLGLQTRRFINHNPAAFSLIQGQRKRLSESLLEHCHSGLDDPYLVLESIMTQAWSALSALQQQDALRGTVRGKAKIYADLSFRQYMNKTQMPDDVAQFIDGVTGILQYEHASFLEVLLDYFSLLRTEQVEIVGGMSRLTDCLAGKLKKPILFNQRVEKIIVDDVNTTVISGTHRAKYDQLICTLPAPAVALLDFEPSLPTACLVPMRSMHYARASKTLVRVSRRTWEEVDGIAGGGSFSDQLFQQCWYPSDNVAFQSKNGLRYGDPRPRSRTKSQGPGVLTASYTWESKTSRIDALSEHERTHEILSALRVLHPQLIVHIEDVIHHSWSSIPGLGGGAFAYLMPGEHRRHQRLVTEASNAFGSRLSFAGEHMSTMHAWIQGAIMSALDCVFDVLSAPRISARSMPA
jgi:monoamine oxidase